MLLQSLHTVKLEHSSLFDSVMLKVTPGHIVFCCKSPPQLLSRDASCSSGTRTTGSPDSVLWTNPLDDLSLRTAPLLSL